GRGSCRPLVRHLAEAIDVPSAPVCEFGDPPRGLALAVWERDRVAEYLDFDFTTSPAAEVLSGELVHFPTGVLQRFPGASFLAARGIDGYMAVPLHAGTRAIPGFLSVFDLQPL